MWTLISDHILMPEVMITKWWWLWWWWGGWWHHSSSESCQRWQPFTSLCLCPTGNSLRWWKIYYRVRDLWSVQCSGVDMGNGLDTWWVIVDESYRSDDEDHDDDNCDVDQFTIHIFVPLSWPNFVWLTHWRSTFEILRGGTILEIQIVDASGVEKPPPPLSCSWHPLPFLCPALSDQNWFWTIIKWRFCLAEYYSRANHLHCCFHHYIFSLFPEKDG